MAHGVHPQLHLQFGIGSPGVLTHCIILISCYNITMIMISRSAKWNQLVTYSEPVGALNRRPFLLAKRMVNLTFVVDLACIECFSIELTKKNVS